MSSLVLAIVLFAAAGKAAPERSTTASAVMMGKKDAKAKTAPRKRGAYHLGPIGLDSAEASVIAEAWRDAGYLP